MTNAESCVHFPLSLCWTPLSFRTAHNVIYACPRSSARKRPQRHPKWQKHILFTRRSLFCERAELECTHKHIYSLKPAAQYHVASLLMKVNERNWFTKHSPLHSILFLIKTIVCVYIKTRVRGPLTSLTEDNAFWCGLVITRDLNIKLCGIVKIKPLLMWWWYLI